MNEDLKQTIEARVAADAVPPLQLDSIKKRGRLLRRQRIAAFALAAMCLVVIVAGAAALVPLGGRAPDEAPVRPRASTTEERVALDIWLRDDLADPQPLLEEIAAQPGVVSAIHISKREAFCDFVETFRDQPEFHENLPPDALPASISVVVEGSDAASSLETLLEGAEGVDAVQSGPLETTPARHEKCTSLGRGEEDEATSPEEWSPTMRSHFVVTPYHCGIAPVSFEREEWYVPNPPFDDTSVPEDWGGSGWMTRTGEDTALFKDDASGIKLRFDRVDEEGEPPPCL